MRDLEAWRENPCRAPLTSTGLARWGKTWLIKEFEGAITRASLMNMDNNSAMRELFDTGYDIDCSHRRPPAANRRHHRARFDPHRVRQSPGKPLCSRPSKYFDEDPRGFFGRSRWLFAGNPSPKRDGLSCGKVEALDLYPLSLRREFALAAEGETVPGLIAEPEPGAHPGALKSRGDRTLKTYCSSGDALYHLQSARFSTAGATMTHGPFRKRILADYERASQAHRPPARPERVFAGGTPSSLTYPKRTRVHLRPPREGRPGEGSSRKRPHVAEASRPYLPGAARIQTRHPLKAYRDPDFKVFLLDVACSAL